MRVCNCKRLEDICNVCDGWEGADMKKRKQKFQFTIEFSKTDIDDESLTLLAKDYLNIQNAEKISLNGVKIKYLDFQEIKEIDSNEYKKNIQDFLG